MIPARKKSLRAQMKERLATLDRQELHRRSHEAAERLCDLEPFLSAQAVMIFLPLAHEIDATPIALRAWQAGKTVAVPLVHFEQRHMLAVEIRSLGEPMQVDAYGLRRPLEGRPVPVEMLDLVVVPGLIFDRRGYRVGRGGGFYDRFLSQPGFNGWSCGLCLEEQVVEQVPIHEHDVRLDLLVTDRQVLRFEPQADRTDPMPGTSEK